LRVKLWQMGWGNDMIAPSDEDYKFAKKVVLGRARLAPHMAAMRDWMQEAYPGLRVVSLWSDVVEIFKRPRLIVAVEREEDLGRFMDGPNFNVDEQRNVARKFADVVRDLRMSRKVDTDNLLVVFSAFDPVARTDANWKVTKADLAKLQSDLRQPEIWTIYHEWTAAVFFFQTDEQLLASEGGELRAMCVAAYNRLASRYDDVGVLKRRPIDVSFDSRENFEKNYEADWFNYSRR
jgi:hypothetical protein